MFKRAAAEADAGGAPASTAGTASAPAPARSQQQQVSAPHTGTSEAKDTEPSTTESSEAAGEAAQPPASTAQAQGNGAAPRGVVQGIDLADIMARVRSTHDANNAGSDGKASAAAEPGSSTSGSSAPAGVLCGQSLAIPHATTSALLVGNACGFWERSLELPKRLAGQVP